MAAETDPSLPVTTIRPGRGFIGLNVRELLSYHELLYFFVWRDLKVRYRQAAFGAAWALIQPVGMMLVLTLVLGQVSGIAPQGVPYPIFALAGLVPWTLFSQSLVGTSGSLVNSASVLQKVYFPRLLLPCDTPCHSSRNCGSSLHRWPIRSMRCRSNGGPSTH
jgi:lipopolysaccharide transport system permease protein